MILLATILQAVGVAVTALGLGLIWFPLGVLAVGAGLLLFGLALEDGGK
jgi:hypothetical protein